VFFVYTKTYFGVKVYLFVEKYGMRKKAKTKLQRLFEIGIALGAFLLVIFLLPDSPTPSSEQEPNKPQNNIEFVIHESASEREMFFKKYELDDVLSGEMKEMMIIALEEEFANTTPTQITQKKYEECELPRPGDKLQHGESTLAYQQRKDVPSICNVERRICNDWILEWTFVQRSCKENIDYIYTKHEIILYNEKPTNPYIQTPDLAGDRNAYFSSQGKRNESLKPITTRNNVVNNVVRTEPTPTGQRTISKNNCRAPWGEIIQHTHFTKAYKTKLGFTNRPCEVELRFCSNGDLEGTFRYPYCEYIDMVYQDYDLDKEERREDEDKPSIWQLIETFKE